MVLSRFPRLAKNLPLLSFAVASSALSFQILVLYPWHLEIDRSHHHLSTKIEELSNDTRKPLLAQQQQQATIAGNTTTPSLPAAPMTPLQNVVAKLGGVNPSSLSQTLVVKET